MVEHAVFDHEQPLAFHAFTVEGAGSLATAAQRIVGDGNGGSRDLLAHHVAQEAGLAGNGRSVDRAGKMAGDAARDAGVEHHVDGTGLGLARAEAAHGALTRPASDRLRRVEVGIMLARGKIVIALHGGALARDHAGRARKPRSDVLADETVRCGKHQPAQPGAGGTAAGIGHALDRKGGLLGCKSAFLKLLGRDLRGIEQVEIDRRLRQQGGVRQSLERVLRRYPGHRDRALGKRIGIGSGRGRNAGDPLPDEDTKRYVFALRRFRGLDLAETHRHTARTTAHRNRVRRVRTGALCRLDKRGDAIRQFRGFGRVDHRGDS